MYAVDLSIQRPEPREITAKPTQLAIIRGLARTGPAIQSQLSDALGCEPPSVTLMARKVEAGGHIRRKPAPSDRRAIVVEGRRSRLGDHGRERGAGEEMG
ncbi:MarR family protein [Nonomuraea maritima]|uniref:MarR family protein n=1 Tax=Nonomuraea maritima TaxID=683260 RepID=A0A1G9RFD2_9ACTN|nr:MarR family transcriptional regulator [Nonomuraea maritima]SDM21934.1 MarR family protein [Nonomuraea maritima]